MAGEIAFDPIESELCRTLLASITEEMGAALERSAFSPNIKERKDDSCAIFDARGQMVAMGDDLPVHLGSMSASVQAFLQKRPLKPQDVGLLNDPFSGGSHLPDLTMVQGVFDGDRLLFYVANRAHHSDVGGMAPGSMSPAEEIYQEGLILPPLRIVRAGVPDQDILDLILANVRTPAIRLGDLKAQIAACHLGERRLLEAYHRMGDRLLSFTEGLLAATEKQVRQLLRDFPKGSFYFEDFLDGGFKICVTLQYSGENITVDFQGSSPQIEQGSLNCPYAVTCSAVYYCFRCLMEEPVPFNSGFSRVIRVLASPGSIVHALRPMSVAAGNVETSQRIVDVVFGALAQAFPDRIPAASQGTMNNFSFGGTTADGQPFAYYETVGGGTGAWAGGDGESAIQSHMTNTLNTPIEALELELPVRVRQYRVRKNSGGLGLHQGGDGLIREIEFLQPVTMSLLADRREFQPYGLSGGQAGVVGQTMLVKPDGAMHKLPSRVRLNLQAGDAIRLETPGGGGFGRALS